MVAGGAAVAAVSVAIGSSPAAAADERPQINVDIIGDSYTSGEGMTDTYFDAEDRRHRSPFAPGGQATQRVRDANPQMDLDATMGASSGATTRDFFGPQIENDQVVNGPQRDQVRPDADAVIVGLGGNDARFADVLTEAWTSFLDADAFDEVLREVGPQLNSRLSDQEYRDQAANSAPGQAPTLTARLLQVMEALQQRAPGAELVVPNYPMAIDPQVESPWSSGFSQDEMREIQAFGRQLNAAIARAVEVCGCATLADVSESMRGREVYTDDPALNDLGVRWSGSRAEWSRNEPFHPNVEGGALMSDAIARALAEALGLNAPAARGDHPTPFRELREAVPDADGDGVADRADASGSGTNGSQQANAGGAGNSGATGDSSRPGTTEPGALAPADPGSAERDGSESGRPESGESGESGEAESGQPDTTEPVDESTTPGDSADVSDSTTSPDSVDPVDFGEPADPPSGEESGDDGGYGYGDESGDDGGYGYGDESGDDGGYGDEADHSADNSPDDRDSQDSDGGMSTDYGGDPGSCACW
ncbi:hypothetical protein DEH69_23085 [Streptomyces sp. PT12]|nr:hypothetical protein DEH69_23085 [Streptomyces sp. PT12]